MQLLYLYMAGGNKKKESGYTFLFDGCGGKTRTYDLWVMSPTSYQLLHSAICFP